MGLLVFEHSPSPMSNEDQIQRTEVVHSLTGLKSIKG